MDPADKFPLRATGQFEVEGKSHFFADLPAYWRTFATREHAIMAVVLPSRYLLLGALPDADLGMWYMFFDPQMVETIMPGDLTFGTARRPALEVSYRCPPDPAHPRRSLVQILRRRPPAGQHRTIYLSFDDEVARR